MTTRRERVRYGIHRSAAAVARCWQQNAICYWQIRFGTQSHARGARPNERGDAVYQISLDSMMNRFLTPFKLHFTPSPGCIMTLSPFPPCWLRVPGVHYMCSQSVGKHKSVTNFDKVTTRPCIITPWLMLRTSSIRESACPMNTWLMCLISIFLETPVGTTRLHRLTRLTPSVSTRTRFYWNRVHNASLIIPFLL